MPDSAHTEPLAAELAYFNSRRAELCAQGDGHMIGRWVVVQDETMEGSFSDWETALKVGFQKFGVARPFLVQEVLPEDRVIFIGAVA